MYSVAAESPRNEEAQDTPRRDLQLVKVMRRDVYLRAVQRLVGERRLVHRVPQVEDEVDAVDVGEGDDEVLRFQATESARQHDDT
jgi:hypothetical protein